MMSRTGRGWTTPAASQGARRAAVLLAFGAVSAAAAGCGSGVDVARTLDNQEQIRQARSEGARNERIKQLERKLRDQKDSDRPAIVASAGASTSGSTSSSKSCGDGITAGPVTTCEFARNVRDEYFSHGGGDISVTVYSPVTGKTYVMSCHTGTSHTCTGGNNASVYFP
jgi:hypothetical protein